MTKQTEGAFLFWARDWLTDEAVVLMSPAAKGVYIDLLCHCWLEGSIPACSTQCSRIARVDAETFAELWAELCPLFVEHPDGGGRLVNRRMESERAKQEERRKVRSDKAKRAAEKRWSGERGRKTKHARGNAPSNANASTQALPRDAHQSKPSTTPLTPQGEGPIPSGEGAAASRPAEAPPPAARPATTRRGDDGESPIADVTTALLRTRYRAGLANAIVRRGEIRSQAERLVKAGLTVAAVAELDRLAGEKSNGDPGALLAHWLDRNEWRAVLDERAEKDKRLRLGRPSSDDEQREPKPASSVVDDVLKEAKRA